MHGFKRDFSRDRQKDEPRAINRAELNHSGMYGPPPPNQFQTLNKLKRYCKMNYEKLGNHSEVLSSYHVRLIDLEKINLQDFESTLSNQEAIISTQERKIKKLEEEKNSLLKNLRTFTEEFNTFSEEFNIIKLNLQNFFPVQFPIERGALSSDIDVQEESEEDDEDDEEFIPEHDEELGDDDLLIKSVKRKRKRTGNKNLTNHQKLLKIKDFITEHCCEGRGKSYYSYSAWNDVNSCRYCGLASKGPRHKEEECTYNPRIRKHIGKYEGCQQCGSVYKCSGRKKCVTQRDYFLFLFHFGFKKDLEEIDFDSTSLLFFQ